VAENLRSFRRDIARLKQQGLIPGKIDARSVVPDQKVRGKKLSTYIRKFDDVLSNKQTAVKVPPQKLRAYRKAGKETAYGRVLVPHNATDKVSVERTGNIVITHASGIERVDLPVEFKNVKQFLRDAMAKAPEINRLKRKEEYFAIRFKGGQRANAYGNIESLLQDLAKYDAIQGRPSRVDQEDFFQGLEIVRMSRPAYSRYAKEYKHIRAERKQARNRRYKSRGKRTDLQKIRRREQKRMEDRAYRKRLKGKRLEEYRAKARARYAKNKRKKGNKKKNRNR
jgi:hypothetical protein